jgi:hypothetical protein
MTSLLSVFAKPTHGDEWLNYVRQLQPVDILILDPDIQQVSDAHVASPESEITIRRWEWDDGRTKQNPHGVYARLRDDPEGLARWQVDQYAALLGGWEQEAKRRGIPFPEREQLVLHLTNEPDTNTLLPQINRNTVVAAKLAWNIGCKVDGLNLSTGHPALLGPDGTPDWTPLYEALETLEKTGSYAVLHEYFNSLGILHEDVNPWHIKRHHWAPRGPKYKIGEFGLEEILNGLLPDHHGWQGRIAPEAMAFSTAWYLSEVRDDVVAVRLYMTDFVDRTWRTFDTTPIHSQLIAVGRGFPSRPVTTSQPHSVYLPNVSSGKPGQSAARVTAPAGANVRRGPGLDYEVLGAEPLGTEMKIIGRNEAADWWQVDMPHAQGWVSGTVVATQNTANVPVVEVAPPAEPPTDNWQRCRAFVRRWEGGFQDHDWDIGNWTGCAVGKGEKKGTKYGISACSYPHLNIRNLTPEQADEIFFRDYWQASGADQQPWPLCLLVMDAAVNFHPVTARKWLEESGGNPLHFVALRLRGYRKSDAWPQAGDAWVDRVIEIALEASKN